MFYIKYFAAIVCTLTVAAICFLPGNELPNSPFLNFDKLVHLGIFVVLTVLWYLPYEYKKSNRWNLVIALLLIIYGGIIEVVQHKWIEGRSGDVFDLIANALGVLLVFLYFLKRNIRASGN